MKRIKIVTVLLLLGSMLFALDRPEIERMNEKFVIESAFSEIQVQEALFVPVAIEGQFVNMIEFEIVIEGGFEYQFTDMIEIEGVFEEVQETIEGRTELFTSLDELITCLKWPDLDFRLEVLTLYDEHKPPMLIRTKELKNYSEGKHLKFIMYSLNLYRYPGI